MKFPGTDVARDYKSNGDYQRFRSARIEEWRWFADAAGDDVADLALLWCSLAPNPADTFAAAMTVVTLAAPANRHALCEWLRGQMLEALVTIERERFGLVAWAEKGRLRHLETEGFIGIEWAPQADGVTPSMAYAVHIRIYAELTDGEGQNVSIKQASE